MQTAKRATIRQVAEQAGVSVQTVSRVLNARPDVAESTRQRVQETIERLGFRPSAVARSLIHRRTHAIGVVSSAIQYFGPATTLAGIEEQASDSGLAVLLTLPPSPNSAEIGAVVADLLSRQVDGIVWAVPQVDDNQRWIQDHPRLPVPVVFLTLPPAPGRAVVEVDNREGGRLATGHLLDQGYRHIGLITGPLSWWVARDRQAGWADALSAAGAPAEPRQVAEGDWGAESGARAFARLRASFPEMDAVFASNDQMAHGVLHVAWREGIRVPEDLGVIGFDDIPEAAYFIPPLTTVCQELGELGRAGVRMLGEMIAPRAGTEVGMPAPLRLEPRLVVRASSLRQAPGAGLGALIASRGV